MGTAQAQAPAQRVDVDQQERPAPAQPREHQQSRGNAAAQDDLPGTEAADTTPTLSLLQAASEDTAAPGGEAEVAEAAEAGEADAAPASTVGDQLFLANNQANVAIEVCRWEGEGHLVASGTRYIAESLDKLLENFAWRAAVNDKDVEKTVQLANTVGMLVDKSYRENQGGGMLGAQAFMRDVAELKAQYDPLIAKVSHYCGQAVGVLEPTKAFLEVVKAVSFTALEIGLSVYVGEAAGYITGAVEELATQLGEITAGMRDEFDVGKVALRSLLSGAMGHVTGGAGKWVKGNVLARVNFERLEASLLTKLAKSLDEKVAQFLAKAVTDLPETSLGLLFGLAMPEREEGEGGEESEEIPDVAYEKVAQLLASDPDTLTELVASLDKDSYVPWLGDAVAGEMKARHGEILPRDRKRLLEDGTLSGFLETHWDGAAASLQDVVAQAADHVEEQWALHSELDTGGRLALHANEGNLAIEKCRFEGEGRYVVEGCQVFLDGVGAAEGSRANAVRQRAKSLRAGAERSYNKHRGGGLVAARAFFEDIGRCVNAVSHLEFEGMGITGFRHDPAFSRIIQNPPPGPIEWLVAEYLESGSGVLDGALSSLRSQLAEISAGSRDGLDLGPLATRALLGEALGAGGDRQDPASATEVDIERLVGAVAKRLKGPGRGPGSALGDVTLPTEAVGSVQADLAADVVRRLAPLSVATLLERMAPHQEEGVPDEAYERVADLLAADPTILLELAKDTDPASHVPAVAEQVENRLHYQYDSLYLYERTRDVGVTSSWPSALRDPSGPVGVYLREHWGDHAISMHRIADLAYAHVQKQWGLD